jgi:glutathione S-transferase
MSEPIVVYGFETSNNMKVRVALGYKGIPYSFQPIEPGERKEIVRISGQHLTPVMVHGERVITDSAAIQRHLDVHFRDTPKLYGGSVQEQWAIEDWELFGRKTLADPMMAVVHTKISGGEVSDEMKGRCQDEFNAAVEHIALQMEGREWLVGDQMTAADIAIGAVLHRIKLASLFEFPASADRLWPFVDRVMAFDGVGRE